MEPIRKRKLLLSMTLLLALIGVLLAFLFAKLNENSFFYCYMFNQQAFKVPKTFSFIENLYTIGFEPHQAYFDYIIIGAGTAGSIIAEKLAKQQNSKILVIEAGENANGNILNEIPGLAPLTWSNKYGHFGWDYSTSKQTFMFNRSLRLPAGKLLGGSSSINFMIFSEPIPYDYNKWKNVTGCNNWDWHGVEKYFHKIQRESVENTQPTKLGIIWANAWSELNQSQSMFHEPKQRMFIKNGLRWNTVKQSLFDATQNSNIVVLKNNMVDKILFEGEFNPNSTNTAKGICIVDSNGRKQYIQTKKSVILSSGPMQNVKILTNSFGTNACELLGKKFKDHLFVPIFFEIDEKQVYGYSSSLVAMLQYFFDYLFNIKGPLAQTIIDGGHVYLDTANLNDKIVFHEFKPDLQFALLNTLFDTLSLDKVFSHFFDASSYEVYKSIFSRPSIRSKNGFIIFVVLTQPDSFGTIEYNDSFHINPNYLSNPRDLRRLLIGIKHALDVVFKTRSFAGINKILITPSTKELDVLGQCEYDSSNADLVDDQSDFNLTYWSCYIKKLSYSYFHYSGTVKFGQKTSDSILDCDLKVKNTDNLFVVDSSVMPLTVSGGSQAATMMIAEKFVDDILFEP
jgi:choline dehydrogenase-like flavoprotein